MIQKDIQSFPGRQIIIRHLIQAQRFERPVIWNEEGVPRSRNVRCQISQIQEPSDMCKTTIRLQGQEGVAQELGAEPWESQQGRCFFVPVLLVEPGDDAFAHE